MFDRHYDECNGNFSVLLSLIKSKSPDVIFWGSPATATVDFVGEVEKLDVNARDLMVLTVGLPAADFSLALDRDVDKLFSMTRLAAFVAGAHAARVFRNRPGCTPTLISLEPSPVSKPSPTRPKPPARLTKRRCSRPPRRAISKVSAPRSPFGRPVNSVHHISWPEAGR